MEESTRAIRESVLNRDVLSHLRNRRLPEITVEDLGTLSTGSRIAVRQPQQYTRVMPA